MRIVERLAAAGLDVSVNVAPLIPGVSEAGMVQTLEAAAKAVATRKKSGFRNETVIDPRHMRR